MILPSIFVSVGAALVFAEASYGGKGGAGQPQGGTAPPKRPFEGGAQSSGPPGKRRRGGDSRKKCFRCNGFGHFIADCPLSKGQAPAGKQSY